MKTEPKLIVTTLTTTKAVEVSTKKGYTRKELIAARKAGKTIFTRNI